MKELHDRLQILEDVIAETHAALKVKETFIVDSGAQPTHTTTTHAGMHPSTGTLTQTATGQRVRITRTGHINIQTRKNRIQVPAVHTPKIMQNVLSVHDLTQHGHVTFTPTHAHLLAPSKIPTPTLTAHYKQGQYRLTSAPTHAANGARTYNSKSRTIKTKTISQTKPSGQRASPTNRSHNQGLQYSGPPKNKKPTLRTATTMRHTDHKRNATHKLMHEWHLRLGHAHPKTIAIMSKNGLLPPLPRGLTDNSAQITCSGCIDGKTTTRPHRRTTHNTRRGNSLSSDVCGPIKPISTHNANYFLTVIDTATRYIWVYCLTNRAQVPTTIINAIEHIAAQNEQYLRLLVTDNAKEYLAKKVQEELQKRGIRFRPTTPYTPQENALAERINRTLMEKVRAILSHSQLPDVHWQDTLYDAVFKYNLTYHHGLKIIPHTAWYDTAPHIRRMFTFGQVGYTPILKPNAPKLQHKATPVRYMYGIYGTHICVQDIVTRRYTKMRADNFRPYHKHRDPCTTTSTAFTTREEHKRPSQPRARAATQKAPRESKRKTHTVPKNLNAPQTPPKR